MDATCSIPLPGDYRVGDVLAFHRRDVQTIAERVENDEIAKGLLWEGRPACLRIALKSGRAEVVLAVDGGIADAAAVERMARRMLGLTQDIARFERDFADHPEIGAVVARRKGLRVPATATPFEAITWAITGQQISVGAATSIRRRLIQAVDVRHSGGLWCYPDADHILRLTEEGLRPLGFSAAKARTIQALSEAVASGELPLDTWTTAPDAEEIRRRLREVRGIGPWTISYALLRGFGWLDGSLHGDVAVRRNLQVLLGRADKLTEAETEAWLAPFSPWRAMVAAHLWMMQADDGY
jgi:DNA-3-methyladenine glycosylase II